MNKKLGPWPPFTSEHMTRLLPIFDGDHDVLRRFAYGMEDPINEANDPLPTPGEMKAHTKKARDLFVKFIHQFRKTEVYWDMFQSEEYYEIIRAMNYIHVALLHHSQDQLYAPGKRISQYRNIAAAVGRVMAKNGVTVSSYYSTDHGGKGNAAKAIEICIDAAQLEPTHNLKDLALIALRESKVACY